MFDTRLQLPSATGEARLSGGHRDSGEARDLGELVAHRIQKQRLDAIRIHLRQLTANGVEIIASTEVHLRVKPGRMLRRPRFSHGLLSVDDGALASS